MKRRRRRVWSGATKKVTRRRSRCPGSPDGGRVGGCAPRVSRPARGSAHRGSLALPAPPGPPLSHVGPWALSRSPGRFRGTGRGGASGRACHLRSRWAAWPYRPAGVGTASTPRASLTAAAGTFLVFGVAERNSAAFCSTP